MRVYVCVWEVDVGACIYACGCSYMCVTEGGEYIKYISHTCSSDTIESSGRVWTQRTSLTRSPIKWAANAIMAMPRECCGTINRISREFFIFCNSCGNTLTSYSFRFGRYRDNFIDLENCKWKETIFNWTRSDYHWIADTHSINGIAEDSNQNRSLLTTPI